MGRTRRSDNPRERNCLTKEQQGRDHGFPLPYCGRPTKTGKNAGADASEQDETEWQDHHLAALDLMA